MMLLSLLFGFISVLFAGYCFVYALKNNGSPYWWMAFIIISLFWNIFIISNAMISVHTSMEVHNTD